MATTKSYKYLFKGILIGDAGSGKTCLLSGFLKRPFEQSHLVTIGVDFGIKIITNERGERIKLQIWDCAGFDTYRALIPQYYRGCAMIFVVYDVTVRKTFKSVPGWLRDARQYTNDTTGILFVLVANKCDKDIYDGDQEDNDDSTSQRKLLIPPPAPFAPIGNNREVSTQEGSQFAEKNNMLYIETSARTHENVEEMFTDTANIISNNIHRGVVNNNLYHTYTMLQAERVRRRKKEHMDTFGESQNCCTTT